MANRHIIKLVVGEDPEVKGDIILAGIEYAVSDVNEKCTRKRFKIKSKPKGGLTVVKIIDTYKLPLFRVCAEAIVNSAEDYEELELIVSHRWDWLGSSGGPEHYDRFVDSLRNYVEANYKQ